MNINLHARNIDTKFRTALYAMGEFAMFKLVPSKRLRNNITLNIHLKHHSEGGEAMISEYTNPKRPREFKIIIDHHRAEVDDYGRERDATEWAHNVLQTLAHELVHVKQYVLGELKPVNNGFVFKKTLYSPNNLLEYFDQPFEIEAYGREKGLLVAFLDRWKLIEEELGIKI